LQSVSRSLNGTDVASQIWHSVFVYHRLYSYLIAVEWAAEFQITRKSHAKFKKILVRTGKEAKKLQEIYGGMKLS
jgi:hypothetical protein